MKKSKKYLLIGLLAVIVVAAGIGGVLLFRQKNSTENYDIESAKISVFDDDDERYYLQRAEKDIFFVLEAEKNAKISDCKVTDAEGKKVKVELDESAQDKVVIYPPEDGYEEGGRYTLTLPKGVSFQDENLKEARTLEFSIQREEVFEYEYEDDVVEVKEELVLNTEDLLDITDIDVDEGEIVFGQDENGEYVAYKVENILEGEKAYISYPSVDELYSELNVHAEGSWDWSEIVANPEFEKEVKEKVENSEFMDSLMRVAYADEYEHKYTKPGIDVSWELTDENSLSLELTLNLEPGSNGLFGMQQLKHQKVSIMLNPIIHIDWIYDIDGVKNWEVGAVVTTNLTWKVMLTLAEKTIDNDELENFFSGEQTEKTSDIRKAATNAYNVAKKLSETMTDKVNGALDLFTAKMPIPYVPGLYFEIEVALFVELELAAVVDIGQTVTSTYCVGVLLRDGEFDSYSRLSITKNPVTLSLRGSVNLKSGIQMEIGATLVHDEIAHIDITPRVGIYGDLFVTVPIAGTDGVLNSLKPMYSYFEMGLFGDLSIDAMINLFGNEVEFNPTLVSKEKEFFSLGSDKIALSLNPSNSISRKVVDNEASLPVFTLRYFDVKDGIVKDERVSFNNLRAYASDSTPLKFLDNLVGKKVKLPAGLSNRPYIYLHYMSDDESLINITYHLEYSKSYITGRVSNYDNETPLEGATVKLYNYYGFNNEYGSMLKSTTTDRNGKFTLNVVDGTYLLVIEKDGYTTLRTRQTVGTDETKYTEHILLLENEVNIEVDGNIGTGDGSGNDLVIENFPGTASGTITNAMDGQGISDATIKIREDWNNTEGEYYGDFETITNYNGEYTIEGVPNGYYTVEASQNGFVAGHSNVVVTEKNSKDDFDFTITPELDEGEVRIVLTWGARPSDLDSHLIGNRINGGTFQVYYSDKYYTENGIERVNLDVDDTTSYGPETITILEDIVGTYTYYVHDYSNKGSWSSNALSLSDARVRVYLGSTMVAEYYVPTDKIGTYWSVFQIDETGRIFPINKVGNSAPGV